MTNTGDKKKQVLARLQRYCALQDRSVQKIREKLFSIEGISSDEQDAIVTSLLKDKFLDDERFTENYIRSKINQNRWGQQKIKQGLIRHRIPSDMISRGLKEMDHKTYFRNLNDLLKAKQQTTDDKTKWMRYLLQRGYLIDEVLEVVGGKQNG